MKPTLRATPEDFRVDEELAYEPSGEGGHTYIHLEKRLLDTEEVARMLARKAGVRPADVGYAGRKDRAAVTTQWFSVPDFDPDEARAIEFDGVRVIDAVPHGHKLRVGRVRSNRFELAVRGVEAERIAHLEAAADAIRSRGLANRFGPQRFGRGGRNIEKAIALARGEWRERDRRKARFLHSALQSWVFNAVLDARETPLDEVEVGDVAQVVASGGQFVVEDLEREQPRAAAFEISATGPIFGPKAKRPEGAVGEREQAVLESMGLAEMPRPKGVRARGDRRALRAPVPDLEAQVLGPALLETGDDRVDVRLAFTLPSGTYATVLVDALVGEVEDAFGKASGMPAAAPGE